MEHQFTFDPAAASLDSATLTLSLRDDNDRFIGELGFGWTESGTWDFGEVDTGDYAYGVNVDYLYDGIFQVKLGSAFGDFYIDKSVLAINLPTPSSNNALNSIPSNLLTLIVHENFHENFNEVNRNETFGVIWTWMQKNLNLEHHDEFIKGNVLIKKTNHP